LPAFDYEAQLVIANFGPGQIKWAEENGFREYISSDWNYSIVRKQIELFKPDLLYLSHPVNGYDSTLIRSLSSKPDFVVGWRAAAIPPGTDWTEFDVILSHLSECRKTAIRHGARKAVHFHPGFSAFVLNETNQQPVFWDVVFSGQWSSEHTRRNAMIRHACVMSMNGPRRFSFGMFLAGADNDEFPKEVVALNQGAKWGMDMYRALKSGRIALNAEIGLACGEAGNMRMFEAAGVGSLLLTERHNNVRDYFEPGKEIETFANDNELVEKIGYYLDHTDEREAIAKEGQRRCLQDYSMERRAEAFDDLVRQYGFKSSGRKHARPQFLSSGNHGLPLLSGSLGEILVTIEKIIDEYPRRIPGKLRVDGFLLEYADLHSFFYQAKQIFADQLYGFKPSNDQPLILDCGAHIGLAAIYFATRFPGSKIHAFEADPKIAGFLEQNIRSFGLKNVLVHPKAVWVDANGVDFHQTGDDSGRIGGHNGTRIPSMRLRDFLNESSVDLLKLDIEGAEYDVLADCDGYLNGVRHIIVEAHRFKPDHGRIGELLRILEKNGFDLTFGDLHHATWVEAETPPPFSACGTPNFVITIFAWRNAARSSAKDELVDPVKFLIRTAVENLNAARVQEALHCFDQVIGAGGMNPDIQAGRAIALGRLGRNAEALQTLRSIPAHARSAKANILLEQLESGQNSAR
jgi:spore maturation protein CgeB